VVGGGTSRSLPGSAHYKVTHSGMTSKGTMSACFILGQVYAIFENIASFCTTANHWSDNITSIAYVKDVAVPYFRDKIAELRAVDTSSCKAFGEQVCVLIVDCWWGWLDATFKVRVPSSPHPFTLTPATT
jgi:hypothetical protein